MTPTSILRAAAAQIREHFRHDVGEEGDFMRIIADWFESVTACCDGCMDDPEAQTTEQRHALRAARLYFVPDGGAS